MGARILDACIRDGRAPLGRRRPVTAPLFLEADQAALDSTARIGIHVTGGTWTDSSGIPAMIPALSLRPQGRLKLGPTPGVALLLHVATVGQVPGIQGLAGMAAGPRTRSDGDAG